MLKKLFAGSIAQNTLKTTLVFGVRLIAQASTLILLARLLGPAQFGEFSAIAALAVLMGTLSTFGTHIVLIGETAVDPAKATEVLRWAIPTTLCCGTVLFFIYLGVATLLFHTGNIAFSVIALIGITELLVQPMNQLACAELQGMNKIATSQAFLTLPLIFRASTLIIIFLLQTTRTLDIFSLAYFFISCLSFFLIVRTPPSALLQIKKWKFPSRKQITKSLGYAILNLTYYGTSEADKVLAPKLTGQHAAGIYTASSRILGALTLPVIAMTVSAIPKIFKTRDTQANRHLSTTMIAASLAYGTLTSVALWFFCPIFVLLLGNTYAHTIETIKILSFACPAVCLRLVICTYFMASQTPWRRACLEGLGIFFFITLAYTLNYLYGYNGFLYATILSEWGMALLCLLLLITSR